MRWRNRLTPDYPAYPIPNISKRPLPNVFDTTGIAVIDNAFGQGMGRMYGRWIDSVLGSVRSNGHNVNDLIIEPGGIIESLFRDEVFVERDLKVTSTSATNKLICSELTSSATDHYKYAEIINVTTDHKTYITGYDGSTKELTLSSADASMAAGDNFFLTNVQGDYKIDYASFDAVDSKRNGWAFARSINAKQDINTLIDEILYNSHCILFESADEDLGYSKLKIKAIDKITGSSEFGTWTKPAISRGVPKCSWELTNDIYTSFKLYYAYDYGKGDYQKSMFVDKNNYVPEYLSHEHQNLCRFAENTYKVSNPFVYSSNYIYDELTAQYFLDKKIRWHTEQRLKVNWSSPLYSTAQGSITHEIGDQGFLSYTEGLPAGYEYQGTTADSHKFMITSKRIITNPEGVPFLNFNLIDLGI